MPLRPPSFSTLRLFSTTTPLPAKPLPALRMRKLVSDPYKRIPDYPYGPSQWYKQSNMGLYGSTRIQFGNKVSERNEIKTRRKWHPNIRSKRLWSEALTRFVRVKVHSRVLRTIDKVGGLDEYLLGDKAGRVKELGVGGWALRWRIMRTEMVKKRFRAQKRELGLPEEGEVLGGEGMGLNGKVLGEEELKREEREFDRLLDEDDKLAERDGAGHVDESMVQGSFMSQERVKDPPRVAV